MTRVFLAAGVAALAIAAPASADPHGGPNQGRPQVTRGGGGQRAEANVRGGGRAFAEPRMERQAFAGPRMQEPRLAERPQRQERVAMERSQRAPRAETRAERQPRAQRMQAENRMAQSHTAEQRQMRMNREHAQTRMAERQHASRAQLAQNRAAERRTAENRVAQNRVAQNRAAQNRAAQNRVAQNRAAQNRVAQNRVAQNRLSERQQLQANRTGQANAGLAGRQQLAANGQTMARGNQVRAGERAQATLLDQRRALVPSRIANANAFQASRLAALTATPRTTFVAPAQAAQFVGQPISAVTNSVQLTALPASVSYLYPDTAAYYYQYGDGYLYQVDRSTSLVAALIPLLAGGFLPGTYLPSPYMSSYVPAYYGLNSFYPASYGGTCNRYAYGVVYQVDCVTGMVVDVVPLYAGGYGVGQMLPSAYSYYNVPMQYRSMYYPTANYSYWYAPGAIYQYDPRSSLITSVAALMSPGFAVGQALPAGYNVYNVPYAYRSTYYDTPTAWYRYNNGYIYQVDPATMMVTATVASLLS